MKEVWQWIKYSCVLWCRYPDILFTKPRSHCSWPQVIKSFFFFSFDFWFFFGDRATGTLNFVRYGEPRQSPSAHTYSLCVCECVRVDNLCLSIHRPLWMGARGWNVKEDEGFERLLHKQMRLRVSFNWLCVVVNRVLSCDSCRDSDLILPSLSFYLLIKYPTLFPFALTNQELKCR